MKVDKLFSFLGALFIFLSPFLYFHYLFPVGILLLYLGKYKYLNSWERLNFIVGLILIYPLYYFIYLTIHRKLVLNENTYIKLLFSYILFIVGNFLIYTIFKHTKNPLKNLAIKFLFFGALGGLFLVGIMVSWIGVLIFGISSFFGK